MATILQPKQLALTARTAFTWSWPAGVVTIDGFVADYAAMDGSEHLFIGLDGAAPTDITWTADDDTVAEVVTVINTALGDVVAVAADGGTRVQLVWAGEIECYTTDANSFARIGLPNEHHNPASDPNPQKTLPLMGWKLARTDLVSSTVTVPAGADTVALWVASDTAFSPVTLAPMWGNASDGIDDPIVISGIMSDLRFDSLPTIANGFTKFDAGETIADLITIMQGIVQLRVPLGASSLRVVAYQDEEDTPTADRPAITIGAFAGVTL